MTGADLCKKCILKDSVLVIALLHRLTVNKSFLSDYKFTIKKEVK